MVVVVNLRLLLFCITTLSDWLKNLAPLSRPIKTNKTKTNRVSLRTFSRASCRLHVFVSSFHWFTELSVFFVIG